MHSMSYHNLFSTVILRENEKKKQVHIFKKIVIGDICQKTITYLSVENGDIEVISSLVSLLSIGGDKFIMLIVVQIFIE